MFGFSDFSWADSNDLIFESMKFVNYVLVPFEMNPLTLFDGVSFLFVILRVWEDFDLVAFLTGRNTEAENKLLCLFGSVPHPILGCILTRRMYFLG
jgi:hypothetical protein